MLKPSISKKNNVVNVYLKKINLTFLSYLFNLLKIKNYTLIIENKNFKKEIYNNYTVFDNLIKFLNDKNIISIVILNHINNIDLNDDVFNLFQQKKIPFFIDIDLAENQLTALIYENNNIFNSLKFFK